MGENFLFLLNKNKDNKELMRLFNSATGIVISHRLGTAFYFSATGFIYLRANLFYYKGADISPDTSSDFLFKKKDYRSEYYKSVSVGNFHYIRDESGYLGLPESKDEMELKAFRVILHELIHAADYHLKGVGKIDTKNIQIGKYTNEIIDQNLRISDLLSESSHELEAFQYCHNRNYSNHALWSDCNFSVESIVEKFHNSNRATIYGHFNKREHLATLFESYLMYKQRGVQYGEVLYSSEDAKDWLKSGGTSENFLYNFHISGKLGRSEVKEEIDKAHKLLLGYSTSLDKLNDITPNLENDMTWDEIIGVDEF